MKLLVEHPYYCSDNNFYSNEASETFQTFADFYEEYHDADIDLNLIFRFDVFEREDSKRCYAQIFIIRQRKGIFSPVRIEYFDKQDEVLAIPLLQKHWQKLIEIWEPISKLNDHQQER